ncbi:MAG: dihydropteroate synthase [Verrucomicrobia bacterium]|nr:dihydropteroate synthase [Verrucomicrobiota bacterium]
MGIVNLTEDSFSGDGTLDVNVALRHARTLVAQGADIIDVGGESARTNREAIDEHEEIRRVLPFVERFTEAYEGSAAVDENQLFPPLLSINTWRPAVARAILRAGGDLLNDLSALPTDENARIAAAAGAALLVMHSIGLPKQRHTHVLYEDVMQTLHRFFEAKIAQATRAGLRAESVLLDPGLDFGKQKDDNLRILRQLDSLRVFGRPILLPVSRKTVLGEALGIPHAQDRDAATVACIVAGMLRGANLFRVHNVHAASQTVRVIWPVVEAGGSES